jgi:hypothetical protein
MTDLITRIQSHAIERDGCWIWHGAMASSGNVPIIRYNNKSTAVRRAILIDRGVSVEGYLATYTCGNHLCVNPDHVERVSRNKLQMRIAAKQSDGQKALKGRNIALAIRAKNPNVKHSMAFAREIRAAEGSQREIAKRYGIGQSEVSAIRRGATWKEYVRCPLTGAMT